MLVDRIAERKRFNEDEPQLRLLSQLFHRCISLPLVDAKVLVNYGSDKDTAEVWGFNLVR